MRRITLLPMIALLLAALTGLPGCNTVKGIGTDIHDVAQNVQIMFEEDRGYVTNARTPSPSAPSRAINRQASTQ